MLLGRVTPHREEVIPVDLGLSTISHNPSIHPLMNIFLKIFALIGMALLIVGGTSCNTVHGVGTDVKHVGHDIERVAN